MRQDPLRPALVVRDQLITAVPLSVLPPSFALGLLGIEVRKGEPLGGTSDAIRFSWTAVGTFEVPGQVDQVNDKERTFEVLGVNEILGGCSPGLKAREPP